jgi:hypothetical protein
MIPILKGTKQPDYMFSILRITLGELVQDRQLQFTSLVHRIIGTNDFNGNERILSSSILPQQIHGGHNIAEDTLTTSFLYLVPSLCSKSESCQSDP